MAYSLFFTADKEFAFSPLIFHTMKTDVEMWHNILRLPILAFQTLCPVTMLLNWVTPSGKLLSPSTDLGFSTCSWVRRSLGEHSINSSTKTTTKCTSKFRRFLTLPWLRQPCGLWFLTTFSFDPWAMLTSTCAGTENCVLHALSMQSSSGEQKEPPHKFVESKWSYVPL